MEDKKMKRTQLIEVLRAERDNLLKLAKVFKDNEEMRIRYESEAAGITTCIVTLFDNKYAELLARQNGVEFDEEDC